MAKPKLTFDIRNIGPHSVLNKIDTCGSLKLGVFANNGTGKTFISRMFRLTDLEATSKETDKLLKLKESNGSFKFILENSDDPKPKRELNITIQKGINPIITNDTELLFHTFNSDYVSQNLEACKYAPDGNIEGYILGKTNIDVSKEKIKLKEQIVAKEELSEKIKVAISEAKSKLDNLGVNKRTNEYKEFTFDYIVSNTDPKESLSFTELKKQQQSLKTMPDDLEDIPTLQFSLDESLFDSISKLLSSSFTKNQLAQEFKDKIKGKIDFIKAGLTLQKQVPNNICPFCEQELLPKALDLIDEYNKYIEDTEAKVIKELDRLIDIIKATREKLKNNYSIFLKLKIRFDEIKNYLPSFIETNFESIGDPKDLESSFDSIKEKLNKKKDNITNIELVIVDELVEIQKYITNILKQFSVNNKLIQKFNDTKNNLSKEKLEINKRLCRSLQIDVKNKQASNISLYKKHIELIAESEADISLKENQAQISKKEKVAESLKEFLNFFFKDKYIFDEQSFSIQFQNIQLKNNVSDVLSEGEKSIVSFCYYLAETHRIVSNEDDYKKLFFIIDDPISSLDFHYVYAVSQIIRNIGNYFGLGERIRYLIFTHNIEFMSILMSNKILTKEYILNQGVLDDLKGELMMPYEAHLNDIFQISEGKMSAQHTTPNSIRHVVETINRFEFPLKKFEAYFKSIKEFEGNEFLYSLIQDGSHGGIRLQKAYTEDMIKTGCDLVINFVKTRYSGQIDKLVEL